LRVRRFERMIGSGGDGGHRGGDGIVRELEALDQCEGTVLSDRRETQPYGLSGGGAASPGNNAIVDAAGTLTPLAGKARFSLRRGEGLRITTPGGGAWGKVPP
jgi:N-methylhydantoinase B